jgi:hypothetical protein
MGSSSTVFVLFILVLLIILLQPSESRLPYSFSLVFAGSSFVNACNGVGDTQTLYSTSEEISEGTQLFSAASGGTPAPDGEYGYMSQGTRLTVSGGNGIVLGIVACA